MKTDIFKEIDSLQKEINSYRPLNADFLKQIKDYYKIGRVFNLGHGENDKLVRVTHVEILR